MIVITTISIFVPFSFLPQKSPLFLNIFWISTELSKKGKRKRLNSYEVGLLQFSFSVSHFQLSRDLGSVSYRVMLVVQFYSFEMSNNQVRAKNASFDIQGFGDSNKE